MPLKRPNQLLPYRDYVAVETRDTSAAFLRQWRGYSRAELPQPSFLNQLPNFNFPKKKKAAPLISSRLENSSRLISSRCASDRISKSKRMISYNKYRTRNAFIFPKRDGRRSRFGIARPWRKSGRAPSLFRWLGGQRPELSPIGRIVNETSARTGIDPVTRKSPSSFEILSSTISQKLDSNILDRGKKE